MRIKRTDFAKAVILLTLLFLRVDTSLADSPQAEPSKEGTSEAPAETEADKRRAQAQALRMEWVSGQLRIEALEADAKAAVGEDKRALHRLALQLKLERMKTLEEATELIAQMKSAEEDASDPRRVVTAALPGLRNSIRAEYAQQIAKGDRLKSDRAKASDADAIASLDSEIQRNDELLLRILDAGVDVEEAGQAVGAPSQRQSGWLEERIRARARLADSHVELASERLDDIVNGKTVIGNDSAYQAREAEARRRIASALETLRVVVGLMDRIGLDTAHYRQVLIASTGEITVDSIDGQVAGELIARWVSDLREGVADNGPRVLFRTILFVVIVGLFWGFSRFVRKIVSRAVEAPNLRLSELLKRMLVAFSTGTVFLLGLLVALSQMGIEVGPMLTGLGIAGFVIGFALQDTLGNFASGVMILIYRPFDVGDMIDCAGGVFGKVSHMSLVSTTILTIDNKTLIVPNTKIWGDVITNVTAQSNRRVDLEFGIGYSDDISHAEGVLRSIVEEHPKVLADPEPVVKLHSLGDSSVNFIVRPWVARDDYWDVHWDITREVKMRFDREGVSIPFPQRDVHFYPTTSESAASAAVRDAKVGRKMEVGSTAQSGQDEPDET